MATFVILGGVLLTLLVNHVVRLVMGGRRWLARGAVATAVLCVVLPAVLWMAGRVLAHGRIELTSPTLLGALLLLSVAASLLLQKAFR